MGRVVGMIVAEASRPLLMRELLGESLRELRNEDHRTLREVSHSARVSLGYLSEVERGQKEASSELLNAICGALDVPLSNVLRQVSDKIDDHHGITHEDRPAGRAGSAAPRQELAGRTQTELDAPVE